MGKKRRSPLVISLIDSDSSEIVSRKGNKKSAKEVSDASYSTKQTKREAHKQAEVKETPLEILSIDTESDANISADSTSAQKPKNKITAKKARKIKEKKERKKKSLVTFIDKNNEKTTKVSRKKDQDESYMRADCKKKGKIMPSKRLLRNVVVLNDDDESRTVQKEAKRKCIVIDRSKNNSGKRRRMNTDDEFPVIMPSNSKIAPYEKSEKSNVEYEEIILEDESEEKPETDFSVLNKKRNKSSAERITELPKKQKKVAKKAKLSESISNSESINYETPSKPNKTNHAPCRKNLRKKNVLIPAENLEDNYCNSLLAERKKNKKMLESLNKNTAKEDTIGNNEEICDEIPLDEVDSDSSPRKVKQTMLCPQEQEQLDKSDMSIYDDSSLMLTVTKKREASVPNPDFKVNFYKSIKKLKEKRIIEEENDPSARDNAEQENKTEESKELITQEEEKNPEIVIDSQEENMTEEEEEESNPKEDSKSLTSNTYDIKISENESSNDVIELSSQEPKKKHQKKRKKRSPPKDEEDVVEIFGDENGCIETPGEVETHEHIKLFNRKN